MTSAADPSIAEAAHHEDGARSAFYDVGAHARLWIVAGAALALDLWTKSWAFAVLGPNDVHTAIPAILTFRRSINPGALFGMGRGLVGLFIVASFVALAFVMYLFAGSRPNRRSLHVALSFVLAGSLGNLYDRTFISADRIAFKDNDGRSQPEFYGRVVSDAHADYVEVGSPPDGLPPVRRIRRSDIADIRRVGIVRDFLKFEPRVAGRDVWPWVFNVADSLLVAGVGLLMINFWMDRRAEIRAANEGGPT
ncbi:MAG: signal peptidase II [Phycisphaerales bacterium]|nr:signal peptidase II [Phycisphaerales bacterium]